MIGSEIDNNIIMEEVSEVIDFENGINLMQFFGRNILSLIKIFFWFLLRDSEGNCVVK